MRLVSIFAKSVSNVYIFGNPNSFDMTLVLVYILKEMFAIIAILLPEPAPKNPNFLLFRYQLTNKKKTEVGKIYYQGCER